MTSTPAEPITGNEDFAEVYALATGRKQRVPRHFLGDPVLGAGIRMTPSQRELDGDLPARPTQDSLVEEIDEYADTAGIDFPSKADKTAKLTAVEAVFAATEVQAGLVEVEPDPAPADPLDPALIAQGGDGRGMPGVAVAAAADPVDPDADPAVDTPNSDGTAPADQNPAAAGNEEN